LNKPAPKLGAMDLNLLVVFDAIMRDKSVTRAGLRLGLSQPAMSHALTRLRHMLKDDLFVRSPNGMMPTPRAEELAAPVRIALDGLQQSLEPVQFEPSKATVTFRIAVDNYAAIVLVAPIASHIAKIAPGVTLDFRPSGTMNVLEQLDRSELNLAIGPPVHQQHQHVSLTVGQPELVTGGLFRFDRIGSGEVEAGTPGPALCPGRGALWPCSPRPAPFPPPPPQPQTRPCSAASQVLRGCPTSHHRSSQDYRLNVP